jgi:type IV pilus assembly protein PilB
LYAKNSSIDFGEALVEKNVISDENLNLLIADHMKFPYIVLSKIPIPEDISHIIPEKIARKKKVIAFARDETGIKVAMADPRDTSVFDMITQKTGAKVFPYYASERDISNSFKIYKKDLQKTFDTMIKEVMARLGTTVANDAPIAKIVDMLVNYAYQYRTSDIHIEPQEEDTIVRFRMDGVLHDVLSLPKVLHDRVVTRIKVLSRLRTDEHLSAQDGKMRIKLAEENLDIRVSILPIVDGEKVVLRLLASQSSKFSLSNLGMNDKDFKKITDAINKSYGMILSTGPTGSGKSTSIYVVLKILNSREKNITTVEDPVEYRLKGINQIQVNTKTGLTFANGLRSILRQDPNVIFVGEIRDNETAGIAVNAALTGHLVLSTLHTNDAATALPRLTDMKIEPFLVASTVNVIIAQRLLRKICDMCKTSVNVSKENLIKQVPAALVEKYFGQKEEYTLYKGAGCKVCHTTGYNGRVGLFEVLEVSKAIKELITKKADSDSIVQKAIEEGMTTMLEDGLQKVTKGITSLEEVLRVTKVETD